MVQTPFFGNRSKKAVYLLRKQEKAKVKAKLLDLGTRFGVTKHIRLFPPFQEKEVEKYFLYFGKVAANTKWPKEHNVKVFYVMGKALSGELSCPCDRSCYKHMFNFLIKMHKLKQLPVSVV